MSESLWSRFLPQTGGESNGLINVRVSYEHALCLMHLRQSVVKS